MNYELDERLSALASGVMGMKRVADIGADHGYLACYLIENNPEMHVNVSDVSAPSLDKARALLAGKGFLDRVSLTVADGLDGMSGPVDAIVIAGMGAKTIRDILLEGKHKIFEAKLFLQPNQDIPKLRAFLYAEGFEILGERAVRAAGRYYLIIEAKDTGGAGTVLDERTAFLGAIEVDKDEPEARGYYLWQLDIRQRELNELKKIDELSLRARARKNQLLQEMQWLREVV